MRFVYDDGGRAEAGLKGEADDCVVRAIAIATGRPYLEVYDELAALNAETGRPRSARNGISKKVWRPYLEGLGADWVPTMEIGSGCKVHLRGGELPMGRLVARVTKHVVAVIDGEIHDTFDCSRGGTRCVYGYFVVSAATSGSASGRSKRCTSQ